MYFLLEKDGLVLPYVVLLPAYAGMAVVPFLKTGAVQSQSVHQTEFPPGYRPDGRVHPFFRAFITVRNLILDSVSAVHTPDYLL